MREVLGVAVRVLLVLGVIVSQSQLEDEGEEEAAVIISLHAEPELTCY